MSKKNQTEEQQLAVAGPEQAGVALVPDEYNQFLDAVAAANPVSTPETVRPKTLRLDGKAGLFLSKEYLPETKEYQENPFGEKPHDKFQGTVLAVRYFAQWKFKDGSESMISTNEFTNWDEEVRVTKLNWKKDKNDPTRTQLLSTHPDYKTFKAEYGTFDKASGATSYPYDLYASLYILVGGTVHNLRLKGSSRSALFDYFREYKLGVTDPYGNPVREMVQCMTEFGIKENTMPDGTSKYYSCTFRTLGANDAEAMKEVMPAWKYLQDWFATLTPKKVETVEAFRSAGLIGSPTLDDNGQVIPF